MICKIIIITFMLMCYVKGQVEFLNLPEGSKCSIDGVNGVCTSFYKCLNAIADTKKENISSICTYQGKLPIICCTDCELLNDTRALFISPTSGQWYFRNGQKARDKCLDYMQQFYGCNGHYKSLILQKLDKKRNCYTSETAIVGAAGGVEAKRNEFPHMAFLGYGRSCIPEWLCGGSLISENFVLTAGHCISSPSLGAVKYIALGVLKRSDPPEFWDKYKVKRIIAHPEYKSPSKYNDIALLETHRRVSFDINIRPACIHFEKYENDEEATATGWGALGFRRELADTLQSVYLHEFHEEECSEVYPPHRHMRSGYDHNTQMCYGHHQEIRDTCEGDSGGPLQNRINMSGCQWTVIGVTSAGKQCGLVGSTGLYTRVINYLHWIEDIVWP